MRYAFVIAVFSLARFAALAQVTPTTTLSGTVVDATGASVPSAAIELTNTDTHFTKRTETDTQGRFLFNLVPPGAYDLTVTAKGFSTYNQRGITLDVNVPASVRDARGQRDHRAGHGSRQRADDRHR